MLITKFASECDSNKYKNMPRLRKEMKSTSQNFNSKMLKNVDQNIESLDFFMNSLLSFKYKGTVKSTT